MTTRHPAAFVPLLMLAFAASTAQAATHKITWLLGHQNLDYFEEAALEFKAAVEKGSGGDILVNIRAFEADDKAPVSVAARVAKGEAQMGHSFAHVMGVVDSRMYAFDAPYLFRGYRHLEGVFEGALGTELLAGLREHGIVGLSFTYSGGLNGVATRDAELRRPEDLKGLKVGVYGHGVDKAWLEQLGAKAVPLKHDLDRILPMASAGSLDAVVTTWRNFEREELSSEFNRFNLAGHSYLVSLTYVNKEFFNSLPEKYRGLIAKASREAGRIERARTIELNESARRGMTEDRGIRAVRLSNDDQARFAEALAPAYRKSIEAVIGKELVERIRNTSDAPEHPSVRIELSRR